MPKKLLIADDSITIQKVMSITFPPRDYELVIVGNGDDAIRKSNEVKPDLIVADIGMPGKNGYEVCEIVRKSPGLSRIPVLLLAGAFEPFDANRAKSVGADDYIVKPFETQALISKVNELLSRSPGREEAVAEKGRAEAEIEESLDVSLQKVEGDVEIAEAVEEIEAEEVAEEAEEVKPAQVKGEMAPEDLWSMEGFEGTEERREVKAPPPEEEKERITASEIAEEVVAGEVEAEEEGEAIPVAEGIEEAEEFEEGISLLEGAETGLEEAEEEIEEAIPVAEEAAPVVGVEPQRQETGAPQQLQDIQKQISTVLIATLPSLVQKITEEVIGTIAKELVKEAIEKSNLLEVTKKIIEEEFKKVK